MARIAGVELPKDKKIWVSLTYIYGVGPSNTFWILKEAGVDPNKRTKDLTDEEVARISQVISSKYKVEGELRREVAQNIRRLIEINCYRGIRHKKGLPVRGQRTRCNARTRKGPRPRVGGIKKKEK